MPQILSLINISHWNFICHLFGLFTFSGLGFVTSITFIFLVGVFMSSWLGTSVLGIGEWFIKRMPFVRHIYNASKQISAAISPGIYILAIFSLTILNCLIPLTLCWPSFFSFSGRSKLPSLQRSSHHKTSTYWRICIWVHYFDSHPSGIYTSDFLTVKRNPEDENRNIKLIFYWWINGEAYSLMRTNQSLKMLKMERGIDYSQLCKLNSVRRNPESNKKHKVNLLPMNKWEKLIIKLSSLSWMLLETNM